MLDTSTSEERFVQKLRDKFATVAAEPEWLDDPSGITVTEHTGISELDEETQNRLMAIMEQHQMANGKNKLFD